MGFYLAIDIGTSAAKAVLFNQNGRPVASLNQDYSVRYPGPGMAEQDAEEWWQATQIICRELLRQAGGPPLRAVCLSGQVPSCAPVDRKGHPLRPAILWLDRRAQPQVEQIRQRFGSLTKDQPGGNRLDSYLGGYKWLWFRQREPEIYRQTWKIMQATSYINFRLTGEVALDPSNAGLCTPCYNLVTRQWDATVLDWMDLDVQKLPTLLPSTAIIGQVNSMAASQTGIPKGTPVVCGGGDFALSCLGAGVVKKGSAALMLGTAGNLLVPAPEHTDPRMVHTIYFTGDILTLGACMAGGAVLWFAEMLGVEKAGLVELLDQEASQVAPGSDGLVFLPYLLGERTPVWDPHARGVFMGLASHHRRGHLFRAVLEGVAFAFRQMRDIYHDNGTVLREIIAINGGARSTLWRQILADVLEMPIRWRPESPGTLLGAAYLAALGVGDVTDFNALDLWLNSTLDTFPNASHREVYKRGFGIYNQLYGRLRDLTNRE